MDYRVSQQDVKAILDYDPSISDLNPFIAAAEELVTEICAKAPARFTGDSPYTNDRLVEIERWLAAHFVAIRDPRYASESMGSASVSYQQQVGMNLAMTPYGQQAMLLDTKGGLAWLDQHIAQGKRQRAGVMWLGTKKQRWYQYPWRFLTSQRGSL